MIVVEEDWLTLNDVAEYAGMGVYAYLSWCTRLLALQAHPGKESESGRGPSPPDTELWL
ncbi:hypothetical protein ACFV4K_17680 [Nocardia sp. NPDC059764]|uniref:hypothetical protein n=1 Tax=Nocardia sp. NPDC059764 TaxID=3346939 RepID=UPI0036694398